MSYPTYNDLHETLAAQPQMTSPQAPVGVAAPTQQGQGNPWAQAQQAQPQFDIWSELLQGNDAPPAMSGGKV